MIIESYTVGVLAILFVAALVRSTFGFGDALVAMPLLSLLPGVGTADFSRPLVALLILTISGSIALGNRQTVDWKSAWKLVLAAAVGIPVGMLFLKHADERIIKGLLGGLVVAFALYAVYQPELPQIHSDRAALLFGFIAGVLGGAYNTHGPPVAIYGKLRRWPVAQFRATLQAYFFPASLLIVCGDGITGQWHAPMLWHFLYSLPLLFAALIIGRALNARISVARFQVWLHVLLLCSGGALLAAAFDLF